MRTPEEISKGSTLIATLNGDNFPFGQDKDLLKDLYRIIKQAQNEAIKDAAKNAEVKVTEYNNPYSESDGEKTFTVDEQSILKLLK